MNENLENAKQDALAIPEALKRTFDKKKETFVQTEAETGTKDETITNV